MQYIPWNTKLQLQVCDLLDIDMLNKSTECSFGWMSVILKDDTSSLI